MPRHITYASKTMLDRKQPESPDSSLDNAIESISDTKFDYLHREHFDKKEAEKKYRAEVKLLKEKLRPLHPKVCSELKRLNEKIAYEKAEEERRNVKVYTPCTCSPVNEIFQYNTEPDDEGEEEGTGGVNEDTLAELYEQRDMSELIKPEPVVQAEAEVHVEAEVEEQEEEAEEEEEKSEPHITIPMEELHEKMPPKTMKYYLYDEVCIHNKWYDFWIVIHGNVLDLTPMLKDRRDSWNRNLEYLTAFGGKDLSYLFHEDGQPKTEISPVTGKPRLIFPPILEVATSNYCKSFNKIWSQDVFYHIGRITRRERRLRIINTLTTATQLMKICDEDTIYDIQEKYKNFYNSHAGSYLWRKFSNGGKCCGRLNFSGTLDENGLDEPESEIELPPPSIWLYYTDDFTIG